MLFALSAAAHAPALMDAGKKAWAGYKGAKGAVDAVRKFRRAPEEMRFTFQLCSALLDVLPVAEALATRHMSLRIVGAAVVLARQAVQQCDLLQVDADSVDDTTDGWADWMRAGSKLEAIQRVQTRLSLAMTSLQLALSAVAASSLGPGYASSPFHFLPDAFAQAHKTLQEMEMGRTASVLLCGGELWQRGAPPTQLTSRKAAAGSAGAMTKLFACRLRLHRGQRTASIDDDDDDDDDEDASAAGTPEAKARAAMPPSPDREAGLCLWFHSVEEREEEDDDGDEQERERVVLLDETVRFQRAWSHKLAEGMHGDHGTDFLDMVGPSVLCYEFHPSGATPTTGGKAPTGGAFALRPLVLTFSLDCARTVGADERVSAECFEALVTMALGTCQTHVPKASPRGGPSSRTTKTVPLATTYNPARPAALVAKVAASVGPLVGSPGADEDKAVASLLTPVRGLDIS